LFQSSVNNLQSFRDLRVVRSGLVLEKTFIIKKARFFHNPELSISWVFLSTVLVHFFFYGRVRPSALRGPHLGQLIQIV